MAYQDVPARHPTTGKVEQVLGVQLSQSGMLVHIINDDGEQITIHRYGWDALVKAVEAQRAERSNEARMWMHLHPDDKD